MSKVTLEFNNKQIEKIVESLPLKEKIQLVRKLEKETLQARWANILGNIDGRLKKFTVTRKEITREIKAYRKEKHA
ncbi:MAG: hypothetical protein KKC50_03125 [Candidatus Omnitrophica bacterium]|nr:hypothetical protein [Candidatus Omnitrophota bacterium]MBU1127711.1 hypothetical protein [Candidatus Omnitrophota bacterium]